MPAIGKTDPNPDQLLGDLRRVLLEIKAAEIEIPADLLELARLPSIPTAPRGSGWVTFDEHTRVISDER